MRASRSPRAARNSTWVLIGTSVTAPAPKFMLDGSDKKYLYRDSTLALDGDTGAIRWHSQHLNDHWDLDHPFERMLLTTEVAPDADAVPWINPRLKAGETHKVVTGIPGKTGLIHTLDRATGEFLWARPTVEQNVIASIDGATGAVTENDESVFTALGQMLVICPSMHGGKDWEAGAYSSLINTRYISVAQRLHADADHDGAGRIASGVRDLGPASSCPPASTSSAPSTPSRPPPARRRGCTSNGYRPGRWSPPAAACCSAAIRPDDSRRSTRRPVKCFGR